MKNLNHEFSSSSQLTIGLLQPTTVNKNSVRKLAAVPETRGQQVIVLKPVDGSVAETPKDFVDIDALVDQEERDPTLAAAIDAGRKVVAETFYAGDPKTLAFYRMQKGWSQKRLAEEAKTSQSYIARIESGDVDPQMSTARKIASALGITIEMLDVALASGKKLINE